MTHSSSSPDLSEYYERLGSICLDLHRKKRQLASEVIYCEGKNTKDVLAIITSLRKNKQAFFGTRVPEAMAKAILKQHKTAKYNATARTVVLGKAPKAVGHVAVLSAGATDAPVFEEAVVTARTTGSKVTAISDVGVAGLHRLLARMDDIRDANVIIVVAGMEGALASVVAGLVNCPIIAVPTSVGYGANLQGLAPLLTMLNSCAAGISVVNIDNGFGAGYQASLINRKIALATHDA